MRVLSHACLAALLMATTVAAAPALAQDSGLGQSFTGLELKGDQPISIESNSLDVDDQSAIATFSGNVSVAQGPTELRTSKLVVHYDRNGANAAGGAQPASTGSALPGSSSSIKRLEASGKVYVRSADQVATANEATFDMATQQVVMSGDVVLSKGDNVAEGCKLTIKMDTGVARLDACNSRVRMMLTPGQQGN
ncbi:lipopolysaccharide export system protein LptA [Fulvimarina manganoxydans]|uniref:Lipopolysaccharide export system protein LptA n=1 Tax=Fulvimarina manganoxydans TaxID=937218 RepID=A0A1W2ES34_9HYPH|nr:LptA/OstA family protein [Fulvimarina manganoxydans]SMD12455.1 lipopolysaccharide export system protein LptA [Fulvimarina manganoxydans]